MVSIATTMIDAENALKKHDREKFLLNTNYLFETLVLCKDFPKRATINGVLRSSEGCQIAFMEWDTVESRAAYLIQIAIDPERIATEIQQELRIIEQALSDNLTQENKCGEKYSLHLQQGQDDSEDVEEIVELARQRNELEVKLAAFRQNKEEWHIRFKVAEKINGVRANKQVQKILAVNDELVSLFDLCPRIVPQYSLCQWKGNGRFKNWLINPQHEDRVLKALDIALKVGGAIPLSRTMSDQDALFALTESIRTAILTKSDELEMLMYNREPETPVYNGELENQTLRQDFIKSVETELSIIDREVKNRVQRNILTKRRLERIQTTIDKMLEINRHNFINPKDLDVMLKLDDLDILLELEDLDILLDNIAIDCYC
jgi:hypothetical protein